MKALKYIYAYYKLPVVVALGVVILVLVISWAGSYTESAGLFGATIAGLLAVVFSRGKMQAELEAGVKDASKESASAGAAIDQLNDLDIDYASATYQSALAKMTDKDKLKLANDVLGEPSSKENP